MSRALETVVLVGGLGLVAGIIFIPSWREALGIDFGEGASALDLFNIGGGRAVQSDECAKLKCATGFTKYIIPETGACRCKAQVGTNLPSGSTLTGGSGGSSGLLGNLFGNCYNAKSSTGITTTCWRETDAKSGKNVAWCIAGPGRCTDAQKTWLTKFKRANVANAYVSDYTRSHNPIQDRVSIS